MTPLTQNFSSPRRKNFPSTRTRGGGAPGARWSRGSRWVLFLIDATERAADVVDSYWSMQGNMTVFGFGRELDGKSQRWHHLTEVPAVLAVGLLPAADHATISARINDIQDQVRAQQ